MVTPPEGRKGNDSLARWMLVLVLSALMSGAVVLGVVALDAGSQRIAGDVVPPVPETQTDVFIPRAPEVATAVLRIDAPAEGCWSVDLGRTQADLLPNFAAGCGPASIGLEQGDAVLARVYKQISSPFGNLGATLRVDGVVVHEVPPRPRNGVIVGHGGHLPWKRIVAHIAAREGRCWAATIDNYVKRGCGRAAFPLDVEGAVNIFVERQEPAAWPFAIELEADGKVVQTVGPTTAQYPTLDVVYIVQDGG